MPTDPTGPTVANLVRLQRLGNGLSRKAQTLLRELFDDVVAEIARIDPTGVSAASYRQRRLKRLFNSIEALAGEAFDEQFKLLRTDLAGIGKHQALWAADQLAGTIGAVDIAISRGGLGLNTMKAIIDADPFQGETLKGWVKSGRGAASRRIRRQIQIGMTENDTLDQIVRRIRGRSNGRGGFIGGAMRTTTREAEALARTGVNFIATRGHMLTYEQNADVLSGVKFTATLDGNTCFVAGTLVEVPGGLVPIEKIRPGDVVIGGSRRPRRVVGTRKAKTRRVAIVQLSNGETVRCTPDHRWLTGEQKWVEIQHIQPGTELAETLVAPHLSTMNTCAVCGQELQKRSGRARRYCSVGCYRVAQRRGDYKGLRVKTQPCDWCGQPHHRARGKKRDGSPHDHSFCSRDCYLAHHTRKVQWACGGCGQERAVSPSFAASRKYCSHECRVAARKPVPVECVHCGIAFSPIYVYQGRVVAVQNRRTCSNECLLNFYRTNEERKEKIGRAFRGSKHPNWKGGVSYFSNTGYRGPGWLGIAERARKRAGHSCEDCGVSQGELGETLHVHHVVPFHNFESVGEANRTKNLRVLCPSCHSKAEAQTDAVQTTFALAPNRSGRRDFNRPRGERHHKARLTRTDVLRIRARARSGEASRQIARDYPVTGGNVAAVVCRKTWRHVA